MSICRPRFEQTTIQRRRDHIEQEEHDESDGDPPPVDDGEWNDLEKVVKRSIQHREINQKGDADSTDEPWIRTNRLVSPRANNLNTDQLDHHDEREQQRLCTKERPGAVEGIKEDPETGHR